jgi:hypothetical protein
MMLAAGRTGIFLAASLLVSGCSDAVKPSQVASNNVPTSIYSSMSCRQLNAEAGLVQSRIPALESAVERAYRADKTAEAVTWILFWPAAFLMDGNDAEVRQLAQARGELEAITAVIRSKGCA